MSHSKLPHYDVAIIGGGINGVGIARELALRSIRVVVIEKSDLGSGTSSASSKLVHGGLRYLEQGHFSLVFEACRERFFLLQNAPHLVKPLSFLIPFYKKSKRPKWMIHLGLMLYDLLAMFHRIKPHRMLSVKETLQEEPWLNPKDLEGGAIYYDAQMNDARICLETALQAHQLGATFYTYTQVIAVHKKGKNLTSLEVKNIESNTSFSIKADLIVNATGPWCNQFLIDLVPNASPLVRPSKGVHLITKRLTHSHALLAMAKQDNRVFFVIPWGPYSLIGTTDTDTPDTPDSVSVTAEDIAYLLEETQTYFPEIPLKNTDVLASFAGLRPLLIQKSKSPWTLSREEKIIWHTSWALSVVGGKFTTYRAISEKVARQLYTKLSKKRRLPPFKSLTRHLPLYGGDIQDIPTYINTHFSIDSHLFPVSKALYAYIINTYGSVYQSVLKVIFEASHLKEPLTGTSHVKGEVIYAIRYEWAKHCSDFLRRRTGLFLEEGQGLACLDEVASLFAQELNWSEEKKHQDMAQYKSMCQQ